MKHWFSNIPDENLLCCLSSIGSKLITTERVKWFQIAELHDIHEKMML